jgi:hypothetical protein
MLLSVFKRRIRLPTLLLPVALGGLVAFAYALSQEPATPSINHDLADGLLLGLACVVLYLLFHLLILVSYLVFFLLAALVLLSPLLLAFWLLWRYKRKRANRNAYRQLAPLYQQLPSPAASPQEKPIPLMQRRFKH